MKRASIIASGESTAYLSLLYVGLCIHTRLSSDSTFTINSGKVLIAYYELMKYLKQCLLGNNSDLAIGLKIYLDI